MNEQPPAGNRPPPPPPRKPGSGGPGQGQAATSPPPQQAGGAYAPPPRPPDLPMATSAPYPGQAQTPVEGYPQGAPPPPPGQYDPYAQQQGQYYPQQGQYYAPPKTGLPMAAWLGIGGGALALIIGIVVTILLVTSKPAANNVNPGPGPGPGPGPNPTGSGPADTIRNYYQLLGNHDYNGAHALLAPGTAAGTSPGQLGQGVATAEAESGARFQSVDVTNVNEAGDTATATATIRTTNGAALDPRQISLVKTNNKWLIDSIQ